MDMERRISSVHNDRIRQAARLRDRRGRRQQQRIIVDGCREVMQALRAGLRPVDVFVSERYVDDPSVQPVMTLLDTHGWEPTIVASPVFEKIAFGDRPEGIVLVAAEPRRRLRDLRLPANPLVCVLERVEKPGNLGAVVRTADACGVSAVLVADGTTDLYNPNAIRASLGAIFHVPVCADTSGEVRSFLQATGCLIYAARVDGAEDYVTVDFRGPSAVVLGSEAEGLTSVWSGPGVKAVSLPMLGVVDSLNVSVTAAVLCYEALRQRRA